MYFCAIAFLGKQGPENYADWWCLPCARKVALEYREAIRKQQEEERASEEAEERRPLFSVFNSVLAKVSYFSLIRI